MKRHILTRPLSLWLLLAVLLPSVLLVGMVSCFMYSQGVEVLDRVARQRALDAARFIAPASEYGVLSGSRDSLDGVIQSALGMPGLSDLVIVDARCTVLAQSGRSEHLDCKKVCSSEALGLVVDEPGMLAAVSPIRSQPVRVELTPEELRRGYDDDARIVGWVYAEFDTQERERRKQEVLLRSIGLALLGLLLSGFLAWTLARSLSRPIQRMAQAVRQMQRGDLSARVENQAFSSELAALQDGFNDMAQAISRNQEELQAKIDEATRQLSWQAHHDPLTGLANRRRFEQAIDELLVRGARSSDQAVLCFIDLDHFKHVNDSCGHPAGDVLLKDVAALISAQVREDDLVCRVGGDEFAVILRHCPIEHARGVAESIRQAVADYRFPCEGRTFSVGTSIGLVPIKGGHSRMKIMVAADIACYSAKKSGRNRVVEAEPAADDEVFGAELEPKNLSTILQEQRLELYVQGIFALDDIQTPLRSEVLLRYLDDAHQAQSPRQVLAAIERQGLSLDLDLWVAANACAALGEMGRHSFSAGLKSPRMSLNLSRASLQHAEAFLDHLDGVRRIHELEPQQIALEIHMLFAEQAPIDARQFAQLARQRGYPLILEHFDTGSLSRIGSLRPDYLKVMLASICHNPTLDHGRAVMRALLAMAHSMQIKVIVAGVESVDQLVTLREVGADMVQGDALELPHLLMGR